MNAINKNILDYLEENGLEFNQLSGGEFVDFDAVVCKPSNDPDLHFEIKSLGFSISIISPGLFYETFEETEKDLNMKLFG